MTNTDTQFTARFPGITAAAFIANATDLANYSPAVNPFNDGMMADIGRAIIYNADLFQGNFWSRYMRDPLGRGQAVMKAYFSEINSRQYDPLAPDSALFNSPRPSMTANVFFKNYSRQIALEVNDRLVKQYVQTPEMIGDVQAAIMSDIAACAADDLWVASKTFASASVRSAKVGQMYTMTNGIGDAGAGEELVEKLWDYGVNKFKWKSTAYNANSRNTFSKNIHVAIKKNWEYKAFKKLLSETFNEAFIDPTKFNMTFDFVDDFATPAGAPEGAGELCAMIMDDRCMDIVPMPDAYVMETFRNAARHSTAFFATTELAFGWFNGANCAYVFEKPSA